MIALLKRDLSFAALLTLLGTVALTIALSQDHFDFVWVFEPTYLEATFYTAWVAGLVLGTIVAVRDRINGVRDYVRHRPLSPATLQVGRLMTTAIVLALWWVLAPVGSWLLELVGGSLVSAGQLSRYPLVFASMAPAASAAALAMLCARLPIAWWMQAVVAAALLFVSFPAIDQLALTSEFHEPAVFAFAHLAFAVLLALLSIAFAGVERDPDRSWTRRVPRWATALVLAAGVAGGTLLLALFEEGFHRNFGATYPGVGKVGDGFELLVWGGQDRRFHVVDSGHRRTGMVRDRAEVEWLRSWGIPYISFRDPELEPPSFGPRHWNPLRVDRRGFATCLLHDATDWTRRYFQFGRGDRTTPFREGVRLVSLGTDGHASQTVSTVQSVIWAVEPGATEVFCFDPSTDEVRAVPMPDGQRIVEVLEQEGGDPPALAAFRKPSWLVRGERGVYAFLRDGLAPAVPEAIAALDSRRAERAARQQQEHKPPIESFPVADVLAPTVRLTDGTGKVLFEHAYAPRTAMEQLGYATAIVPSLLRSPVLQLCAHVFAPDEPPSLSAFVDPVVAGGHRTWLVLAGSATSIGLALGSRRRLRRAGADARTLRFWSVAVALTGLLGALLCEWFEPSRAWRLPAAEPAPAPRIQTPDAA
ncbi:MAG: hypothetical protein ABL997_07385 [Planctomycetota bacterium]